MLSGDIRTKFLEFFRSKGHEIVPSDSLVPKADPTVLFTAAGMNQFKDQFLGHNVTYRRAASSQKCLRTADLEKVGNTPSHHTFFEMLGNFSFGDYFKKEAIIWAWEFMTEVLRIKKSALWVSVYEKDEETYEIWRDTVKVPKEKIIKLGAEENFWPANAPKDGPNGPCGPCSELFYDWGKNTGCGKKSCTPACSCGRFVEVWNLVFTEFDRKDSGKLEPLPNKNIDTGLGLERITAVTEGKKTNFETDLFKPIIDELKAYSLKLKASDMNAIADHTRAAVFAIADGVSPSNEERGYVIRKLIRRAYIRGGAKSPFLYNLAPKIAGIMKDAYPELIGKREQIALIIKEEEEKFQNTLSLAMPILEEYLKNAACAGLLEGEKIFKLVDTYGLPLEIIEENAKKKKIKLDTAGFENLMKEQRELSRNKSKMETEVFALNAFSKVKDAASSDKMPLEGKIAFLVKSKEAVSSASEGESVEILTDPQSSLFYTEQGGQAGDTGSMEVEYGKGGLQILNTVRVGAKVIHIAKVITGTVSKGDHVEIKLNAERKKKIAKNHTATHLLQSALIKVLGGHVHQAGSLVDENRLRFDFTHMKKLTDRELEDVESLVNDYIGKAEEVRKEEKPLDEAKKEGAIALFGEKYKGIVTVVSAGDFSREVCGGTHAENTKEIGQFKITRESSVASGVRRIEALTGDKAREWVTESEKQKAENQLLLKEKEEGKRLERERLKTATENIDFLINKGEAIKNVKVIIEKLPGANIGILRNIADRVKEKEKSSFVVLASVEGERANIILSLTKDLTAKGLDASKIIKDIAAVFGGSGGGREDFGQAGGKDLIKLDTALEYAKVLARDKLGRI